jgi:Chaperone of endosialidase
MGDASSGLIRLRPVTFRYKKSAKDGSKPLQYGLIAEEVAEVYPELVVHSADGQIEGVKYQVLDSMLLNEVQKEQREIGQQQEHIQRLEEQDQALQERLEKLEAAIGTGSR